MSNDMKSLSMRLRSGMECAPWVVEAVKELEAEAQELKRALARCTTSRMNYKDTYDRLRESEVKAALRLKTYREDIAPYVRHLPRCDSLQGPSRPCDCGLMKVQKDSNCAEHTPKETP